jgi:hypothetical protein
VFGDKVYFPFKVKEEQFACYVKFLQHFHRDYTVVCTVKNLIGSRKLMEEIQKYLVKKYPRINRLPEFHDHYPTKASACACNFYKDVLYFGVCRQCEGAVLVEKQVHVSTELGQCPGASSCCGSI